MKCLPECGYNQTPNNLVALLGHMRECDLSGPLKLIENPVVVWREGAFAVVSKAEDGEATYDVKFERLTHLTLEDVAKLEPKDEDEEELTEEEEVTTEEVVEESASVVEDSTKK